MSAIRFKKINPLRFSDLTRLKDWYHYVFICSIFYFIFNGLLSVIYIISLFFLLSGIYMLNDFFDLKIDSSKPTVDPTLISLKKEKRRLIKLAIISFLLLSLMGFFLVSIKDFVLACLIIIIMFLYSHRGFFLKSKPVIDLLSIFLTYSFLVLTSFKNLDLHNMLLSSFIGFMTLDAHILQSIRDFEVDSKYNLRTTVIYLGKEKSLFLFKIMAILTTIYIGFSLSKILNLYYSFVPLLLIYVVFDKNKNPEIIWKHFKILSAIVFGFIIIGLIL
jgi:4-hydroxybenzoate polyprenyltransferase